RLGQRGGREPHRVVRARDPVHAGRPREPDALGLRPLLRRHADHAASTLDVSRRPRPAARLSRSLRRGPGEAHLPRVVRHRGTHSLPAVFLHEGRRASGAAAARPCAHAARHGVPAGAPRPRAARRPLAACAPEAHVAQRGLGRGAPPAARDAGLSALIDIVIPVYGGARETRRCIESVLATASAGSAEIVVVNDASPEAALVAYVQQLAADHRITLLANERNLGFVQSVNRGMALHDDRDVVLLNSDTEVANDWLE